MVLNGLRGTGLGGTGTRSICAGPTRRYGCANAVDHETVPGTAMSGTDLAPPASMIAAASARAGGDLRTVNIGEAAARSGVPAKTIRYYEDIGLVRPAPREVNGYRAYGDNDVHTLRFVQRARSLGFSVNECRQLLDLYRNP